MPYGHKFTDISEGGSGHNVTSWLWDFGDGTTSTEQNPCHIYDSEGTYNVSLTVTNDCGKSEVYNIERIEIGAGLGMAQSPVWSYGESKQSIDEPYWSYGESGHYLELPAGAVAAIPMPSVAGKLIAAGLL